MPDKGLLVLAQFMSNQQLQLSGSVAAFVGDCRYATGPEGQAIHHLLDEVVAAAVERSTEPQLLDAALMDKILASSKRPAADEALIRL